MSRDKLVFEAFGPLQRVRIPPTGNLAAQTFAAALAADGVR